MNPWQAVTAIDTIGAGGMERAFRMSDFLHFQQDLGGTGWSQGSEGSADLFRLALGQHEIARGFGIADDMHVQAPALQ